MKCKSSIFELQNSNLQQKKANLYHQFFHYCQKCVILWLHFTSLNMHRTHAHCNSLPKWVLHTHRNLLPNIAPTQVVAVHCKSCFAEYQIRKLDIMIWRFFQFEQMSAKWEWLIIMRSSYSFHSSHNMTWYSAIVHRFTRFYPICSTYELTKQFM